MTQPGKGDGWAARGRGQPLGQAPAPPQPQLAQPSPLPRPLRCTHLNCRFQALPRASIWDMDGEDFSEPGEGWGGVTWWSLWGGEVTHWPLGGEVTGGHGWGRQGVSLGESTDGSLCGWIAGGHLMLLGSPVEPLSQSMSVTTCQRDPVEGSKVAT